MSELSRLLKGKPLDTAVCGALTLDCLAQPDEKQNSLPGAGMIIAGDHEIIITRAGTYILRGKSMTAGVRVDHSKGDVTLILDHVDIDLRGRSGAAALRMTCKGDTILALKGDNVLRSGEGCAGVHNGSTSLTVVCINRWMPDMLCDDKWPQRCVGSCAKDERCSECAASCGRLTAEGGAFAAGIGGGAGMLCPSDQDGVYEKLVHKDMPKELRILRSHASLGRDGSCIVIGSGVIRATGGDCGAGIGGGLGHGRVIAVYGGHVLAKGGSGAAGIGGGAGQYGRHIMLMGGKVQACGGKHGAGIGGGAMGCGKDIALLGGDTEAHGGQGAAGIGGGAYGGADDILIRDGCVSAAGGMHGAGMGSGSHGDCAVPPHRLNRGVTIEGGEIKAQGGEGAAGIGGGFGGDAAYIAVHGGKVTARGGRNANAIGAGEEGSIIDMQFTRGEVIAVGGESGHGRMQGIGGLGTQRDVTHTTCRITMTGTIYEDSGFCGGYVRPYEGDD